MPARPWLCLCHARSCTAEAHHWEVEVAANLGEDILKLVGGLDWVRQSQSTGSTLLVHTLQLTVIRSRSMFAVLSDCTALLLPSLYFTVYPTSKHTQHFQRTESGVLDYDVLADGVLHTDGLTSGLL